MIQYYEQLEDTPNSPKGTIWQTGWYNKTQGFKCLHMLYAKTGKGTNDTDSFNECNEYKERVDMKRWFKRISKQQMLEHFKNKK